MDKSITRHRVMRGGAVTVIIPFAEWLATYGVANAGPPMVRHNIKTAAGAAMAAKYATAVKVMMGRGLGEPCGWTFQWYTHQIKSSLLKANAVAGLPVPQQALANDMWNTCQAHFGRSLDFFLPWHRMYVYFLERIVRKACGDPLFTLPYWDYIDTTQRSLPAQFRTSSASPLFSVDRNAGQSGLANVNAGQAIDTGQPSGTLNLQCMQESDYLQSSPNAGDGFCATINNGPHGIVHSLIGNGVGMGSVPWAANDPIFWLHHTNIDRLWASWNKTHANPATSSWRDQTFIFADENCNRVQAKASDFAALAPLNYTYDSLLRVVPSRGTLLGDLRLIAATAATFHGPTPDPGPLRIAVDQGAVTIKLKLAGAATANFAADLRAAAPTRVRLKVADLQADASPGVLYHVYLNLPEGASPAVAAQHYVGPFSFFDVMPLAEMAAMAGHDMAKGAGPSYSFGVTELVRRLGPTEGLSITIVPSGQSPANARPIIGEVSLQGA